MDRTDDASNVGRATMEWVTSISFAFLCCISPSVCAVLGSERNSEEGYRPWRFPLCSLVLIMLIELINYESEIVPLPDRSDLIIVLMRIGVTLSTMWGVRFIIRYHRNETVAITFAILTSVLVGIYWVAVAIGTFPAVI